MSRALKNLPFPSRRIKSQDAIWKALSRGIAREWNKEETYVLTLPNWGIGSDHRPIVATFEAADR
jgi:hypothetical protein